MVISISGPASTGKTTLINQIKSQGKLANYKNIIIVNEIIREMFKEDFLPQVGSVEQMMEDKDYDLKWVKEVGKRTSAHIKNEINKYNNDDTLIILDRCTLDHFIYSLMHTIKFSLTPEEFYEFVKEYSKRDENIDYIFLTSIPENDFYEIDGIRPKTWENTRYLENSLFELIFKEVSIKLPHNNDDRIKVIEDTIIKKGDKND